MPVNEKSYRKFLLDEFLDRKTKNASYSLRAYARDLSVPVSRLSEIINGKAGISEARASSLADKLKLSAKDRSLFLDLAQSEHSRSPFVKKSAKMRVKVRRVDDKKLTEDQFSLISDWYHLALMELLEVDGLTHSSESFAKKLGIDVDLVDAALGRLERLALIEFRGNRFYPTKSGGTTTSDVPSTAIRHFHRQILKKGEAAIEQKPIPERDHSAVVFAFDRSNIDAVKNRIREFRRELMTEYQSSGSKDSVYCMAVQLFELTEKT